jgi:hypothetical protein
VKRKEGTNSSVSVAASNVTSVSGEIAGMMASLLINPEKMIQ